MSEKQINNDRKASPSAKKPVREKKTVTSPGKDKQKDENLVQLAEQDASRIVAQAYERAGSIINDAKRKARYITESGSDRDRASYAELSSLVKSGRITEHSYKQIDEIFVSIKQYLELIAASDKIAANELETLILQLEYWVESLVIESMKLKSLERWLQGTKEYAKILRATLDFK